LITALTEEDEEGSRRSVRNLALGAKTRASLQDNAESTREAGDGAAKQQDRHNQNILLKTKVSPPPLIRTVDAKSNPMRQDSDTFNYGHVSVVQQSRREREGKIAYHKGNQRKRPDLLQKGLATKVA